MGYIKAAEVLPINLLIELQNYIDGEYVYIPRKEENKKTWGTNTDSRRYVFQRNAEIAAEYTAGKPAKELAKAYCLSVKTIYKILADKT